MEENSEKVSVENVETENNSTAHPKSEEIKVEDVPDGDGEPVPPQNVEQNTADEDSTNVNSNAVLNLNQEEASTDTAPNSLIDPELKTEPPKEETSVDDTTTVNNDSLSGNDLNASELLENPAEVNINESTELTRNADEFDLDPMDTNDELHLNSAVDTNELNKSEMEVDTTGTTDVTNMDSQAQVTENIEADTSSMIVDENDTSKNTTTNQVGEVEEHEDGNVAEDIDDGKGADEEVSLLPEREITDADKERAFLVVNEENVESVEKTTTAEKEKRSEESHDDEENNETTIDDTVTEISTTINNDEEEEPEEIVVAPKDFEIKDAPTPLTKQTCFQCASNRVCEFMFQENDENRYICTIECVTKLRAEKSEQFTLNLKKIPIWVILEIKERCTKCHKNQICNHRMKIDEKYVYICDSCISEYSSNSERYVMKKKRYLVDEVAMENEHKCLQCSETKMCKYMFKQENDEMYICHEDCLNLLVKEQPEKIRVKRRSVRVRELPLRERPSSSGTVEEIPQTEAAKIEARTEQQAEEARQERELTFMRHCTQCSNLLNETDKLLNWETLDFCNEVCLGTYQNIIGANCTFCSNTVSVTSLGKYCVRFGYEIRQFCRSICLDEYKKGLKVCSYCQKNISPDQQGYLAPFGEKGQFRDFCTQNCMKKYDEMCNPKKKSDVSLCAVCNNEKPVRVEVMLEEKIHKFCSNPCLSAFKFVNNVYPDQCQMCQKYFERRTSNNFTIYQNTSRKMFCNKICMNIYIITNRKIVPCNWCKVKKYNFDMINKISNGQPMMMCSLNCLTLCKVSMNAISMTTLKCDQCNVMTMPQYLLSMSDASIRNFCTYQCVMSFQSQFSKAPLLLEGENVNNSPIPTGLPKRVRKDAFSIQQQVNQNNKTKTTSHTTSMPVIANVTSLAGNAAANVTTRSGRKPKQASIKTPIQTIALQELKVSLERIPADVTAVLNRKPTTRRSLPTTPPPVPVVTTPTLKPIEPSAEERSKRSAIKQPPPPPPPPPIVTTEIKTQVVVVPPIPKKVANIATMCKPFMQTTGTSCRPETNSVECQTDDNLERKILIPIPVPIYIPMPMYMYSLPTPIPVPIPIPIPVPIFVPTTRNSAQGIMKEIKKIQDKMPTDPFEAELLMMAEIVAGEKKRNDSDSGSDVDEQPSEEFPTETIETSNTFGEDMLQMALKMATEYDEPAVDLESAMPSNTITPNAHPHIQGEEIVDDPGLQHHHMILMEQHRQISTRGRKRGGAAAVNRTNNRAAIPVAQIPPNKKPRRELTQVIEQPQPETSREPAEKADANMCLKFTFGVNAWKQWVMTKNADLEKSSIRRKPFKSDLLQLTADELNYSLCLFVKEVRKPNGSEYAPDTIYYLVLGIQQYLYEHLRIDNIFTDPYYEKFTDCLDEVARKFSVLYNDSQYIVTRVEEEHLWECKQLGAHSPHVLLSTLMFFNTKHFNLTTVEEHMQLSFSHIMKHWKRNPNQPGAAKSAGSRNVLLRFYPPQSSLDNNARKKKVYEQQENEENPLRCPVKLYEFYLSKCPESVKTRNDVFYLQPERSCVPDSPVWYSTQALSREALSKMLHRVKMVKEINIALLTS